MATGRTAPSGRQKEDRTQRAVYRAAKAMQTTTQKVKYAKRLQREHPEKVAARDRSAAQKQPRRSAARDDHKRRAFSRAAKALVLHSFSVDLPCSVRINCLIDVT